MLDVLVVGSGLCGTLAAKYLENEGHSVLVLEGGSALPAVLPGDVVGFQRAVAPVTRSVGKAWAFRAPRGYEWHRVRARGGRTLLWGGWMERPPGDYFDARRDSGAGWPTGLTEELIPWIRRAERLLTVRSGRRGRLHRKLQSLGYKAGTKRESVLLGQRRMLTAADVALQSTVRCASPVVRVEPTDKGVVVHTAAGQTHRAKRVVVAASPVETARILEASLPETHRRRRIEFFDHLIAGAVAIGARQRTGTHPKTAADPSAVMHPSPSARTRFTMEVRGPTPLESLDEEDLRNLGFSNDEATTRSFYVVFAMGETDPDSPRHVEFDPRSLDGLGRPAPRFLARAHTPSETTLAKQMNRKVLALARQLASNRNSAYLIYDALDFSSGGHEVGTCLNRLDAHGQVTELPGVYVADGSGIPAATDRHPSLTLAGNALRVADAVSKNLLSAPRNESAPVTHQAPSAYLRHGAAF